jgi:hypothetical protein
LAEEFGPKVEIRMGTNVFGFASACRSALESGFSPSPSANYGVSILAFKNYLAAFLPFNNLFNFVWFISNFLANK